MANSIYSALGAQQAGGGIMEQFKAFMAANKGKDPRAMIDQIVASGRISQDQLNAIQARASQITGLLDGMRGAYGF